MKKIDLTQLPKGTLAATGQVALVAAADDGGQGGGDGNANRKMRITAYNGGLMDVGWRSKVGVELAGLSWREDGAIPILCLHDAHSLDAICGQATNISHDGKTLTIDADLMPVSEDAKKVHALAKAGFRFQASVGVTPSEVYAVDKGEKATCAFRSTRGSCRRARRRT